jgi:hypothetical protein
MSANIASITVSANEFVEEAKDAIKSSILSISQTFELPLIEGNATTYEIVVPEKNETIHNSILENAIKHKQRIAIRPARLQLLLDMEKKLNLLKDAKQKKLDELHMKEKANPSTVHERVRRYVETHRDEINARRREKRKAVVATKSTSNIIIIKRPIHSGEKNESSFVP